MSQNIQSSIATSTTSVSTQDRRQLLVKQLAKQLTYYFSKQNLSTDVYLQTIMKLNSGYVPISILASFANVNKIIGRSGILLETDKRDEDNDAKEGDDITPIKKDNQDNQKQQLESDNTSEKTGSWKDYTSSIHELLLQAAHQSHLLSAVKLNQNGTIANNDNKDDNITTNDRTFDAIGPSSELNDIVSLDDHENHVISLERDGYKKTEPNNTASQQDKEDKKTSIIIFRDVHKDATEGDIRKVFDENQIVHVQKEIGNCWFITVDMDNTKKDLVAIMLDLKNKTICNEAIRARVKSQTASSSVPSNSAVAERRLLRLENNINNNQHIGSEGRKSGDQNLYSNQIYSGDRTSYVSKKHLKGSYGKGGAMASKKHHQYQQRDGKGSNPNISKDVTKVKNQISAIPPPPVVEEHYPSLSQGQEGFSPTSVLNAGMVNVGYAAALLKQTQPQAQETSSNQLSKSKPVANIPTSKLNNKEDLGKMTIPTISTDDSSSDGKSSLSSKPESDNFTVSTTVGITTAWGGRSFADVLKK